MRVLSVITILLTISIFPPGLISQSTIPLLKKSLEGKQKLDSVSYEVYLPDMGLWIPDSKECYKYDSNGNQLVFITYLWDYTGSRWTGHQKEEVEYDIDGNRILEVLWVWENSIQEWLLSHRREYIYENGLVKQESDSYWSDEAEDWVIREIKEYEYEDGLLLTMLIGGADLNGDGIINQLDEVKIDYSYDQQGKLVCETTYYCFDEQTGWQAVYKYDYTYYSNKLPESKTRLDINEEEWLNQSREYYTYDTEGRMISYTYAYWNYEMNDWRPSEMWEYELSDDGNLMSMTLNEWDSDSGSLVPNLKNEYDHNNDFTLEDLILPKDYPPQYFAHMITAFRQYEYDDGNWTLMYRGDLFYSGFTSTGTGNTPVAGIKVFPNPADEIINIRIGINNGKILFELYDTSGKKVKSLRLPVNGQVSVRDLNPGIYLYKLIGSGAQQTGQLVIR